MMMCKSIIYLSLMQIFLNLSYASWERIVYDPGNVGLNSLDIHPGYLIVAVGDAGLVRISKDTSMMSWENHFVPGCAKLLSVALTSNFTIIAGGEDGRLYRSTNKGTDWEIITAEAGNAISQLKFIDDYKGILSMQNGRIMRTEDGGYNWAEVIPSDNKPVYELYRRQGGDIWISGKGKLLVSRDDGANWENKLSSLPGTNDSTNFYRINAVTKELIFAVSELLFLYVSRDGGNSWTKTNIDESSMYKFFKPEYAGFEFFNASLGIIRINDVSESFLYYEFITSDGGQTFRQKRYYWGEDTEFGILMKGIRFNGEDYGVSYGHKGEITKIRIVTDSLTHFSYEQKAGSEPPTFVSMDANGTDNVAIMSENGYLSKYLFLSSDGGRNWKKSLLDESGIGYGVNSVTNIAYPSASNIIVTVNSSFSKTVDNLTTNYYKGYIFRSTDQGLTFSKYTFPDTTYISGVEMSGDKYGCFQYSRNDISGIKYTTDGGNNWIDLSPPQAGLYAYRFSNPEPGVFFVYYRSGSTGNFKYTLYRTFDYGNTWTEGDKNWGYYTSKMTFKDRQNGFLLSRMVYDKTDKVYHYYIFKTSDSGNSWDIKYTDTSSYYGYSFKDISNQDYSMVVLRDVSPLYVSTDKGENWKPELPPQFEPNDRFSAARMLSPTTCVAVTRLGYIFINNEIVTTAEEIQQSIVDSLSIFPNPAANYIEIDIYNHTIKGVVEDQLAIGIFNMLGERVLSGTPPNSLLIEGRLRLDVSGLAPGVYFVRVGDKMSKFVKM